MNSKDAIVRCFEAMCVAACVIAFTHYFATCMMAGSPNKSAPCTTSASPKGGTE